MRELPRGWRRAALGDVAETSLGKMLDRAKDRGLPRVRYLRNVNVQWGHIDTDDVLEMELADHERDRFGLAAGDLLVCEGGEIGRAAIVPTLKGYMAYQKALHRIRPGSDLDSRFLLHHFAFLANESAFDGLATGSTIRHLPQQQLRRLPIVVPPLAEQFQIVETLEDHLSRLDAADNYLRESLTRLRTLDVAALGQNIDSPSGQTTLGSLISRVEAGRSFGGSAPPAKANEWGVVKVSAMTWGEFRQNENKAVPADRVTARFEIRPGDLLVSRANTSAYVGASVLVGCTRPRLLLSDKSLRLLPRQGVDAEWLQMALTSPPARRQITRLATGTKDSMRNISQPSLLSITLPHVSLSEQLLQVGRVRAVREASQPLAEATHHASRKGFALRRALLAAAFSGQLSGRASDLDVAEELASG